MDTKSSIRQDVTDQALLIGKAAGEFMDERGITQSAVEERIGRSGGYVSLRVTGKRFIDTQVLQGIADLAGLTLPSLMTELASRAVRMGLPRD